MEAAGSVGYGGPTSQEGTEKPHATKPHLCHILCVQRGYQSYLSCRGFLQVAQSFPQLEICNLLLFGLHLHYLQEEKPSA